MKKQIDLKSGIHSNFENPANKHSKSAVTFLEEHGYTSIVSLGCGRWINRIDNHLRLMMELNLTFYAGIDLETAIDPDAADLFMDADSMNSMLERHYRGRPENFWKSTKFFPETSIEELKGVHCAAVVCQRVLPDCRWEEIITSMNPKLVLQEDLHGCERQQLRGQQYVRSWSKIRQYGLKPFRPWPIFPGENNLVLWQRRDFGKFRWLEHLCQSFIG